MDPAEVAQAVCPVYVYDSRCESFPISADDLRTCAFIDDPHAADTGPREWVELVGDIQKDMTLHLDPRQLLRSSHEPIAYWYRHPHTENEDAYVFVSLYMLNSGYDIPCCGAVRKFGSYHTGDVEHVTVVVRRGTADITRVYTAAHSMNQGTWTEARDLELADGGRPVVYIARGSQAAYPHRGTYYRVFGFANDHADGKGMVSVPELRPVDTDTPWANATIGEVDGPARQEWFEEESDHSISAWGRFFACFACPCSKFSCCS